MSQLFFFFVVQGLQQCKANTCLGLKSQNKLFQLQPIKRKSLQYIRNRGFLKCKLESNVFTISFNLTDHKLLRFRPIYSRSRGVIF